MAMNIRIPTKGRLSYGFNFYSDETVLVRKTSSVLTLGYSVPLSENHNLSFGLSGGIGMYNLDASSIDVGNDPAIINSLETSLFVDGQFGILYSNRNLKLGFSLPQLVDHQPFNSTEFAEIKFGPFDHMIVNGSYRINVGMGNIAVIPNFIYRVGPSNFDQTEFSAIVDYKNVFQIGANYRLDYGPALLFGFSIDQSYDFGYAYEFASDQTTGIGSGSHEFQLRIKFGKSRAQKRSRVSQTTPVIAPQEQIKETDAPESPSEEPKDIEPVEPVAEVVIPKETIDPEEEAEVDSIPTTEPEKTDITQEVETEPKTELPKDQLVPGTYVVAGVFREAKNASNFAIELEQAGYDGFLRRLDPNTNLYYIAYKAESMSQASVIRRRLASTQAYSDSWIYQVED